MTGTPINCPICGAAMARYRKDWLYRCEACGLLQSNLEFKVEDHAARPVVNERRRVEALGELRIANSRRILDRLNSAIEPSQKRLLDVGCSHGWFLEVAEARGFDATGIEPDPIIGALTAAAGHAVWIGFFPDDIPSGEQFDIIAFNDVFEHLPDINEAITSCRRVLRPNGLLVLNVPSRFGIFYRLTTLLDRIGISSPLDRMWQVQFASPHLSYFSPRDLRQFAELNGFVEVHASTLPSIQIRGLWARLHSDRTISIIGSAVIWLGAVLISPLLRILPADITLQIFRKLDT